jgi:hypothetical protein
MTDLLIDIAILRKKQKLVITEKNKDGSRAMQTVGRSVLTADQRIKKKQQGRMGFLTSHVSHKTKTCLPSPAAKNLLMLVYLWISEEHMGLYSVLGFKIYSFLILYFLG